MRLRSRKKQSRKYDAIWETIKRQKQAKIHCADNFAETVRKGIITAKYFDSEFAIGGTTRLKFTRSETGWLVELLDYRPLPVILAEDAKLRAADNSGDSQCPQ